MACFPRITSCMRLSKLRTASMTGSRPAFIFSLPRKMARDGTGLATTSVRAFAFRGNGIGPLDLAFPTRLAISGAGIPPTRGPGRCVPSSTSSQGRGIGRLIRALTGHFMATAFTRASFFRRISKLATTSQKKSPPGSNTMAQSVPPRIFFPSDSSNSKSFLPSI